MLIKNKIKLITVFLLCLCVMSINLSADEFDIEAVEILIDKENEIITGKGSVRVKSSDGMQIYADKVTYYKYTEFILAEGNVKVDDEEGNVLLTNKLTYDKINEKINTYNNSELTITEGYKLLGKDILYNTSKKTIASAQKSIFTDLDGNIIETTMFQYDIKNNLFSSVGKIKILDIKNNKYLFKEIYIDTKKHEMIGSDISLVLDQEGFGLSKKNEPRLVANSIFVTKNETTLSKGVFTVCQKRDDDKCPPWSLKAKTIIHDKVKKNIYYDHATLKIYGVPIFYFPRFFHPDPSVKRQSGFLFPYFTNSTQLGQGFALPYYWVINNAKDLTFTPKYYASENPLFLNEYRQVFQNGFLTLDSSYTSGYKNTSKIKTDGSRNHFFADLDLNLTQNESYKSNLSIQVQRTSNDTYFRNHNINTTLVDSENTDLTTKINYTFSKDNMYLNVDGAVYENLRDKTSSRYEFILPNITLGKTFFTENLGSLDFNSNAFYNNYETNKHKTFLTNDIIWTPTSYITKNGFYNSLEGMLRNTNYKTRKTNEYKDVGTVNELQSVLAYKSSLPMKKVSDNYLNLFSPNFMLRFAPGHMRNISSKDVSLSSTNLYSLNKTSEIEDGLSAILGLDFTINEKGQKDGEKEKFALSIGQIFNPEENKDIPSKSSLDQKMSDLVGEINYNFGEIGNIDYKFALDHNFNDLNYNEVSTGLVFGKVEFNLDYLEENNHVGAEHYASPGITLNFNDENKLSFSTKKNFKTDGTEFYDIGYQYEIDCLRAGLVYRREFYQDSDIEPDNNLMFRITFVPFGTVKSPSLNK